MNNILIFEDDTDIAGEIAVRIKLARLGRPIVTHNEKDCLAALAKHDIDLAVLDVDVPGNPSAGLHIAGQLADIPFLFLSGHSQKRFAAYALGPAAFLSKPFDDNTMNTIELALLKHEARQPAGEEKKPPLFTPDAIFVYHRGAYEKVFLQDIFFVRLDASCLIIHLQAAKYLVWVSLDHFLAQVGGGPFIRIHRSHAINLTHLYRFNAEEVQVGDHTLAITKKGLDRINRAVLKIKSKRK